MGTGMVLSGHVHGQDLSWAGTMGDVGDDVAMAVRADADGNTLVVGYFEGVVDMDPGLGQQLLTSSGLLDAFVMKLDAQGGLLWVLQLGGSGDDYATGVDVDATGQVLVTGAFNDEVDFDPGAGTTLLTSAGEHDIFLARYDPAGALLGAWGFGGAGYDEAKSVAAGAQGDMYLLSYFSGTIDADPGAATLAITSQGQLDMLLQRFDANGGLTWAQATGSSGAELGLSMALDGDENIWITGSFEGTVDMDPGPGNFPLTSAGAWDIFVTKRSAAGAFLWAGRMGGVENFDTGYDIAVDAAGNAHVVGAFFGSGDFDPGAGLTTLSASSLGSDEVFVLKLDPSGALLWAVSVGGVGADLAYGVSVTTDGRVLLTGYFSGTADFDPDAAGQFELTTASSSFFDSYLCALGADGTFQGAWQFGGSGSVATQAMDIGADGAVLIAGHFENTADMDPGAAVSNAVSNGFRDAYVLRLNALGAGLPTIQVPEPPALFPNPASDEVAIDLHADLVGASYAVHDELGRSVVRGRIQGTRMRLAVEGLAPGRYLFVVQHPGAVAVPLVVTR